MPSLPPSKSSQFSDRKWGGTGQEVQPVTMEINAGGHFDTLKEHCVKVFEGVGEKITATQFHVSLKLKALPL